MHVVTDLAEFGSTVEIRIDPRTFAIVRYVLFETDVNKITVDFPVVRLGAPLRPADVAFTPPASFRRFKYENHSLIRLGGFVLAFLVSAAVWMFGFRHLLLDAGEISFVRRRIGKWILRIALAGYGVIVIATIALLPLGGHPPAIVIAFVGIPMWTGLMVAIAIVVIGGSIAAERLLRHSTE